MEGNLLPLVKDVYMAFHRIGRQVDNVHRTVHVPEEMDNQRDSLIALVRVHILRLFAQLLRQKGHIIGVVIDIGPVEIIGREALEILVYSNGVAPRGDVKGSGEIEGLDKSDPGVIRISRDKSKVHGPHSPEHVGVRGDGRKGNSDIFLYRLAGFGRKMVLGDFGDSCMA